MKAWEFLYFAKSFVLRDCAGAETRPQRSWPESGNMHSPTQEPHKCVTSSLSGGLDLPILDSSTVSQLRNLNNVFWLILELKEWTD